MFHFQSFYFDTQNNYLTYNPATRQRNPSTQKQKCKNFILYFSNRVRLCTMRAIIEPNEDFYSIKYGNCISFSVNQIIKTQLYIQEKAF